MKKRYYDFNTYLRKIFGERVQKISVDAGLSCPNRDGTLATGGCIYCNEKGSGTAALKKGLSVSSQILLAKKRLSKRYKANKFIAYFQSFSNTYAPFEKLRSLYEEALSIPDIVGLSIGTRPDCIDDRILSLLNGYAKTKMIWVEYGLQSIHNDTLRFINRRHDFECFRKTVEKTSKKDINICVHVILGLPNEDKQKMMETAKVLADMPIDGVKIHLLYIIKETILHKLYLKNQVKCLSQNDYVKSVCDFLEFLPKNVVIQRLTGDPHPQELVAPNWALKKNEVLTQIQKTLEKRDSWQGKYYKLNQHVTKKI